MFIFLTFVIFCLSSCRIMERAHVHEYIQRYSKQEISLCASLSACIQETARVYASARTQYTIHTHTHTHTHTFTYVFNIYIYIYIYMLRYVQIYIICILYIYISICVRACVHVCMYAYVYLQVLTFIFADSNTTDELV